CFEIELIAKYGRRDLDAGTLCNLNNGGTGSSGSLASAEHMRKLHANPEFAKARDERTRKMHADPEFAKARDEQFECTRKMLTDPKFAKAHIERTRKMHADPEFAKAHAERARQQHKDPKFRACCYIARIKRTQQDARSKQT